MVVCVLWRVPGTGYAISIGAFVIGGLGVAGSLGIDALVGNGNGWRLNGLGWFCLRRLWIERVAGLFIELVVVERDGLVDLFWRSR